MESTLGNAFSILLIGMLIVMIILTLVVVTGNLLIRIINRFWALPESVSKVIEKTGTIPSGTLAAIVAAVETVTGGKGKVSKIEKQ